MLDDLDQIEWHKLTHAYGSAADVPGLLRALASDDKKVWDDAIYQFYGNIWHQGTVYEATAYAVPFLIELLEAPTVVCKVDILGLLRHIASGSSFLHVHQNLEWYHNKIKTAQFQAALRRELNWVGAARLAVLIGIPIYLQMLSDPDSGIRANASYVLSNLDERFSEIEPALRRSISTERVADIEASLLTALMTLWSRSIARGLKEKTVEKPLRYFSKISRDESKPTLVRFVAALATVELGGVKFTPRAMPMFRDAVLSCRKDFPQLAGRDGESPLSAVSSCLSSDPDLWLQWLLEMSGHRDAELRTEAIWGLGGLCRRLRSAPQIVVPRLARLVADPDSGVRELAARSIPELGKARILAAEMLVTLKSHRNPKVRALAAKTLKAVRVNPEPDSIEQWLRKPKRKKTISAWISILESKRGSGKWSDHDDCSDAAAALGSMGPKAKEAVPALRKLLTHESVTHQAPAAGLVGRWGSLPSAM